jgi:uncharacterized protein DUF4160
MDSPNDVSLVTAAGESRINWYGCQPFCARDHTGVFFYSADRDEPSQVHVDRDEGKAKFWLEPVRLERSRGFSRVEIGRIERLVAE